MSYPSIGTGQPRRTEVSGISSDKLAKAEAWGRDGEAAASPSLDRLLEALSKSGGRVTLEVDPTAQAIDDTPERVGDSTPCRGR